MSTTPDEPEFEVERERPPLSIRAKVGIVMGLAALTAVAGWVGWQMADEPVRWQDVGFTIDSPTAASVTFDVYLYDDRPVTCHVHAMNTRYAEVGVAQQPVDPADGVEQRFTVEMATVEEATSALVRYCEAD